MNPGSRPADWRLAGGRLLRYGGVRGLIGIALVLAPSFSSAAVPQAGATPLPPVLKLPDELVQRLASESHESPRHPFVILLGPSEPPRDAPIVHIENELRTRGSEAPQFTPKRNLDLVVDSHPPAPIRGVLLTCLSAPLETYRRLWIRDHLGGGKWHEAAVVGTTAAIWQAQPCGNTWYRFVAASPPAVLLGMHRVALLDSADRIGGQLGREPAENGWMLKFKSQRGEWVVASDALRVVEISGRDQIRPLLLCVDGRAAVLESRCAPAMGQCRLTLRAFGSCAVKGQPS